MQHSGIITWIRSSSDPNVECSRTLLSITFTAPDQWEVEDFTSILSFSSYDCEWCLDIFVLLTDQVLKSIAAGKSPQ